MFRALSTWIHHLPAGDYRGVTLADIDGDGNFEVLVANAAGANLVLKFSREQLRPLVSLAVADARRPTFGIAVADVNGDGIEELYLVSDEGRMLRRGADGHWMLWKARGHLATGFNIMDSRGTGRYAIVLLQPAQQLDMLEAGPHGELISLPGTRVLNPSECGIRPPLAVPLDLDGDGSLDAFVGFQDAPHRLSVAQADGTTRDIATPSVAMPSNLNAAVAADFDNDGFEELLLVNGGEQNRLYRIGKDVNLIEAGEAAEPDAPSAGAAVADLDGDGVLELIVSREGSVQVYKPRMAAGNAWLRVRPLTRFQAPARGATVTCIVNGRILVRQIDGGRNGMNVNEPVAHFGLGRTPNVESVSIEWPDGTTLTLPDPDVNCTYSVPYPKD